MHQLLAIAWLRYRLLVNGFRRGGEVAKLVGAIILMILAISISLGIAFVFCVLAFEETAPDEWDLRRLAGLGAFWAAVAVGLVMPLLLCAGTQGIDTSRLLVYPVSRRKLFGIALGSAFLAPDHLLHYPVLIAVFLGGYLLRGEHALAALPFFLVIPMIVVVWAHGLTAALQGVMQKRRGRELVGIVGFGILVLAGLLPAFLSSSADENHVDESEVVVAALEPGSAVVRALPPYLAANGLHALREGDGGAALRALGGLGAWLAIGLLLAYQAFVGIALRTSGRGAPRNGDREPERRGRDVTELFPFLPVEALAVASRELRYLLRSSLGRFNLVMIPLFAAIVAFVLAPQMPPSVLGLESRDMALFGLLLYTVVFTNNVVNNAFGWEGAGFASYILSPVSLSRVILGKNLGVWTYQAALGTICFTAWLVFAGFPSLTTLLTAPFLFAATAVVFTTAGNFASISFPVARSVSSMKSNPSAAAVLLSFAVIIGLGIANTVLVALPTALGVPATRPLWLIGALGICLVVHRASLRGAGAMLAGRKEEIAEVLDAA